MSNYKNLSEFLTILKHKNLLQIVDVPVSTHLELTEISRRVLESGGPALLFNNVINHQTKQPSLYPVLTNLFGTPERISLGLNTKVTGLRELGHTLAFLRHPEPPTSLKEAWGMLPLAKKVLAMKPSIITKAECQQIIQQEEEIDLFQIPIQFCWPKDIAPLITWGVVITRGPTPAKTDNYNLGIYRLQLIGKNKLIMRWLKMRGGAQQFARWKQENCKPFPVSIFIGADPATILAAVMPIPDNMSEYNFAGLLRGEKIELVKSVTNELLVPAHAEFVIEGEIDPNNYAEEGPYGDHTGYYNEVESFPVVKVKAITHKKEPIYLSTYTGKPPDEPAVLGLALNELFIPLIQQQFPEIVDFWLPPEGCSYRIAVISIKKAYPGQAKRIMMGAWSYLRQFMYTKFIIIVDADINVRDWKEVMWAISTRSDPVRDVTLIDHTPIDYLDFASPQSGLGGKMGIDATNKLYPETNREWGEKISMTQEIIDKIDKLFQEGKL